MSITNIEDIINIIFINIEVYTCIMYSYIYESHFRDQNRKYLSKNNIILTFKTVTVNEIITIFIFRNKLLCCEETCK